jgi:RHS repeat-associated protein
MKLLLATFFIIFTFIAFSQDIKAPKDSVRTLVPTTVIADVNSSYQQQLNFLKNVIPPSPTASSLGEYATNNPNLYTGVLPINIPLYELAGRGISVPINLNYLARANKVGETASWVGLGWSLDAGGLITRTVRGLPDEETGGYLDTRTYFSNPLDLSSALVNADQLESVRIAGANGTRDFAPDLFMLNAMGHSYRLIFSWSPTEPIKIITQPYSDIKITVDFLNKTWNVTLEDGTKLIFGTSDNFVEKTLSPYIGEPTNDITQIVSSWYLKSISKPASETINFTYSTSSIIQDASFIEIDYSRTSISYPDRTAFTKVKSHNVTALNLASIESELGRVDFVTSSRKDLSGGAKLIEMKIYDKTNSTYLKQFKFKQTYSEATTGNAYAVPYGGTWDIFRLKLNSLEEASMDSTQKKVWAFNYNPTALPSRHSYAQDHWGFYNGATTNTTLKPATSHFTTPAGIRSPNASYMDAEILTKITYPTGGYSEFAYEPNLGAFNDLVGGIRIKSILDYDNMNSAITKKRYFIYEEPFVIAPVDQTVDYETTLKVQNRTGLTCYLVDEYNYNVRNIFTKGALGAIQGGTVGYGKVTTKYGIAAENGTTVSRFRNQDDFNRDESKINPYPPVTSMDHRRGLSLEQTDYDASAKPLKRVRNPSYTFVEKGKISSVAITMNAEYPTCFSWTTNVLDVIKIKGYDIVTDLVKNNQTIISDYMANFNSDSLVNINNFYYDNVAHSQVTRSENFRSDGKKVTTIVNYPKDYAAGTGFIDKLVAGNMVSYPIETVSYQENPDGSNKEILSGAVIEYQDNNLGLKQRVNVLENNAPIVLASFKFSNVATGQLPFVGTKTSFVQDSRYKTRINFDQYDNKNNLVQYHKIDGDYPTTILYGYNGKYPVAEIKNATYTNVKTALGVVGDVDLGNIGLTAAKENTLRTNANLSASLVTTFDYFPLVGLQKRTEPNQTKTTYNYDNLLRLSDIKDHSGDILKHYEYHFDGQAIPVGAGIVTLPADKNYVISQTPRTKHSTVFSDVDSTSTSLQYFDGLGRSIQSVNWKGSPSKTVDILLSTQFYDAFGRNNKNLLPSPSNIATGNYINNAVTLSGTFYNDLAPFKETEFEPSPVNRPSQIFGPGIDWRGTNPKPQKVFYELAGPNVPLYSLNDNDIALNSNKKYPVNSLYSTRMVDEESNTTIEIKDKEGKLIQKRVIKGTGDTLITHYVYNELNQLKAVLQPNAYPLNADLISTTDLYKGNVFFYKYDNRSRIIEKKLPSADKEYLVYDRWDRLVLSQNAFQRSDNNRWTFYKYDPLGREIYRGDKQYGGTSDPTILQANATASTVNGESRNNSEPYYTLSASFPDNTSDNIYQVNFYDNYTSTNSTWRPTSLNFQANYTPHIAYSDLTNASGMITGVFVKNSIDNTWLKNATYYDYKNRNIQSTKTNHIAGSSAESISTEYNFADEPIVQTIVHKKTGLADLVEKTISTYDHGGRLLQLSHLINDKPQNIATYTYDEISRLKSKSINAITNAEPIINGNWNVPSTWKNNQIPGTNSLVKINKFITIPLGFNAYAGSVELAQGFGINMLTNSYLNLNADNNNNPLLQKIDYDYHIRGGLLGINLDANKNTSTASEGDLFSYKLDYKFDGNISKQSWRHSTSATERSYAFNYDPTSRLTNAAYLPNNAFSLTLNYDANGNISTLKRRGMDNGSPNEIDDLTYSYVAGRLTSVTDSHAGDHEVDFSHKGTGSGTYSYADDGSMITDDNENITGINYDTYLKQPRVISLGGGRSITNAYAGNGQLMRITYSNGEKWDYADNIIYKNDVPFSMNTAEGRAIYDNIANKWNYEYFYSDHLGNTRVGFKVVNGSITKTSESDFDPLNVPLKNSQVVNALQNRFEIQNHEKELTFGLNRINFGARTFNPTIGRFDSVDPLAEAFEDVSPMSYCLGNPITMVDIDGMFADSVKSQSLPEVVVTGKYSLMSILINSGPKLEPFTGFWGNLDYFWNGGNYGRFHYNQQGEPTGLAPIGGTAPDIGIKSGVNTVYKGVKLGLPYIGKAFNIIKRYTKSERLTLQIESVIKGVPDSKLLRAIEQKVLEFKKTTGEVANKINAFDPKRKDYPEYMQKATQWLEQNVPNWQKLFD